MVLLRELIVRYVSWIQSGGVRASIIGGDSPMSVREDTFDILEDQWDFADGDEDGEEELWVGEGGEGLGGDEPPRSLDAMAAISQVRPPKRASSLSPFSPLSF
jgi:hypothetical protein